MYVPFEFESGGTRIMYYKSESFDLKGIKRIHKDMYRLKQPARTQNIRIERINGRRKTSQRITLCCKVKNVIRLDIPQGNADHVL